MALDSRHDVNVDSYNTKDTPLHYAAASGNQEIVSMFLERGAKVAVHNLKGVTPLHIAASCGPASIVKTLITAAGYLRTSIVSAPDSKGATPLHWAINAGLIDVVEVLVDSFSNIDAISEEQTPLWSAITRGHADIAAMLVAKGARAGLKDLTAIFELMGINGFGLIEIICRNPPYLAAVGVKLVLASNQVEIRETGAPLHCAVSRGCVEVVRTLLLHGADVNAKDSDSRTCLDNMCLGPWCVKPDMQVVRLLLEREDVALDTQDSNGNTILHRATILGLKELVEVLVNRGANPTIRNRQGRTPARLAKNGEIEEMLSLACAMLLSKDLIINA